MLIIMNDGSGRTGNKLIFYAQILASSYEHRFKAIYYGIKEVEGIVYDNEELNKYIIKKKKQYCGWRILLAQIMVLLNITACGNLFVIKEKEDAILSLRRFMPYLSSKKVFWYGWPYADYTALRKNYNLICNYFRFTDDLNAKASNMLNRSENDIVCAMDIRRGDYKTWLNGRYFFEIDTYIDLANQIVKEYSAYNVRFVLFSNEDMLMDAWQRVNANIYISHNDAILDLCMMSMCDFIISPPSSFSGWASFIGNVPRYVIQSKNAVFEKDKCFVWMLQTDGFGNQIE